MIVNTSSLPIKPGFSSFSYIQQTRHSSTSGPKTLIKCVLAALLPSEFADILHVVNMVAIIDDR